MVFVTVGSQKFPFDRLLRAVDKCVATGAICEGVFAQTGYCTYEPEHFAWQPFLSRDEFAGRMAEADVVITHAGTGAIVGALKQGKRVVAVPRHAEFGEHVDDHQVEIVETFAQKRHIEPCYDVDDLAQAYERVLVGTYEPFVSNTSVFLADLEGYLQGAVR